MRWAGPENDSSIDAINAYFSNMADVTGAWHVNSGGGGGSSGGSMNYGIFWDQMLASVQHIPDGKYIGIGYRLKKDNLFEFLFISSEYAQRLIDFNTRMVLSSAANIGYGLSFDDPSGGGDGVGQPGTWEGLIPIWGSGRAAVDHFQNGNYWSGIGYSALAISDVFLVKSIATAVGRGAWKVGAHSWSATRQWLGKTGYAEAGQPVHHWAISQATAKQYGIEAFTNQTWNLMTFSNQSLHMRAGHGFNYLGQPGYGVVGQLWFGTPIWPKAVVGSYGGRLIGE